MNRSFVRLTLLLGCAFALTARVPLAAADVANHSKALVAEVILAEIALQRHQFGEAWQAYMAASKLSHDKTLANRAYAIATAVNDQEKVKDSRALLDEIDPENENVLIDRALASAKKNDWKSARRALNEAVKKSHNTVWVIERFFADSTTFSQPKARYELLKSIAGKQPVAQVELRLAHAAKAASLSKAALAHALKATALEPENVQLLLESADFEFATAPEKVSVRLAAFVKKHPKESRVRLAYAKVLVRTSRVDEALSQLKACIAAYPENAQVYFLCGTIAEEAKRFDTAVEYFNRYIALAKADPQKRWIPDAAYVRLGVIALARHEPETALSWFSQVERGDKYIPARVKQAEILASLGRTDEACKVLLAIRHENKAQKADFHYMCSQLLAKAGRLTQALEHLDKSRELSPNNTEFIYKSAILAEQIGWIEKAEKHLRRFIELQPNDPQGYNSLGYMWLDRGIRTAEARPLIEKAMALSGGKDSFITDSMGWLYFREGNLEQAEHFVRLSKRLRADPEVDLHLAEILILRARYEEARTLLRAVLKSRPGNDKAKALLQRIPQ